MSDNTKLVKSFIKIQKCINILFDSTDYLLFKHIINEDEQAILNLVDNNGDAPTSNDTCSNGAGPSRRGRGRPKKSNSNNSDPVEGYTTLEVDTNSNDGVEIENVVAEPTT
jgi:hypothetical protein